MNSDELKQTLGDLLMAQQPIFYEDQSIFAYELLFRDRAQNVAVFDNNEVATSQVLVNLCMGISQNEDDLSDPFFINMSRDLIISDAFLPIPSETVFIEILENQVITDEFINSVQRWRDAGYRFVLDDYFFNQEYDALLPHITIIKVDVIATPPNQFLKEIEQLKAMGISLIAEKVEDESMFELCKSTGFDLYQGYYFQRPEIIKGKKIESHVKDALNLVSALQDDEVSVDEVVAIVERSPQLSFQFLRILKSPVCGIPKQVETIKEVVIYIGLAQLKCWATILTLTANDDIKSSSLKTALVRARCNQLLAQDLQHVDSDKAFIVGLLSSIDLLFGIETQEGLKNIALSDELCTAISEYKGHLGKVLYFTLSQEQQDWKVLTQLPKESLSKLNSAFIEATRWSNEIISLTK
ncbi:EAL and HDOD domain-containing protein [Marinomonas mediterranea]|jgi:Predicted signal transduction protein containing EAL and modified HD-GYP domains|uniref:Diguanylate phosphodiesterase metal dependent hydrolase domain n=1 Tax=Marinomonas mediterranea (strain ATCC 700492 / JCM 21426 / NBRC 103028 / MMB-1) TaxID=717774 RepID=F2JZ50_MARM1|nr:EAL domain-containing protein [Marinomonas mediterranea]ADZ92028.1 diguanylate phosphodiesterase metal dependent hydrolase domain [Marinomonas mediterranea MMB-1]WCN09996.1 EAL domain-containing protein [Marinomonas mediterranea]WCN14044.1 EAL domain-containing protein [Marinomonas mediterranea]WCN18102.1 EAL domain-containing protein [Marinomonas mediterranea MMB-1]